MSSENAIGTIGNGIKSDLTDRLTRFKTNYEEAGLSGSANAGQELGKLLTDVVTVATGGVGLIKGGIAASSKLVSLLKTADNVAKGTATTAELAAKASELVASDVIKQAITGGEAAKSVNALDAVNRKLSALSKAQNKAVSVRVLSDGRIRYYGPEAPSKTLGPTRGASHVTEYDPKTGNVREWHENYNQAGQVNRVHPKSINGQVVKGQHYPPTGKELRQ
ncbi:hypothetical protein [Entomobacter blattae]|uniref:Uncharacterized protein n=1 Tax=Entomobacter blattae TaxID=2762277 RepID=A0A7H1NNN4_9PROT|nr:hypothetical protein [Entomobacter blattae]QNT77394.1 hypothetical protein JGUZn3_01280 [Entomobacter blattae]